MRLDGYFVVTPTQKSSLTKDGKNLAQSSRPVVGDSVVLENS